MNRKPFPVGLVLTLVVLWIGTVAAAAGGWVVMRQYLAEQSAHAGAAAPGRPSGSASSNGGSAPSSSPASAQTAASGSTVRLVWSPEAFWRFLIKAGSASLGAVLFLLIAVGAGFLLQEKVESVNE